MSAAQQSASQDVGWLAKGQTTQLTPPPCSGPHWGTRNQVADFFYCDKKKLLLTAFTAWLMLKIFPKRNYISHLWPASARPAAQCESTVQIPRSPHLKDTSTLPRGCSATPDPWHFWRDLKTCMLWDNFSFSSTPNRSVAPQTQYQHPQTPCSCLWLTTKGISPLCRGKWVEKQRPVLVYYSQLNNLPLSKRKTLCKQPLSHVHPPKYQSDLLAHFKKNSRQHISVF